MTCGLRWSARPTRATNCSRRSSRRRNAEAAPPSGREQCLVESAGDTLEVAPAQPGVDGQRETARRAFACERRVIAMDVAMVAIRLVVPHQRRVVHAGIDAR